MEYTHSITHDAPIDEVFAMLSSREYRTRAAEHAGALSFDITLEPEGEGFRFESDQVQPTDHLPSLARKFAGKETRAIQRETWTSPTEGSFEIEAPGKPSSIKGTVTLAADGEQTVRTWNLDLTMDIPALGPRLEKMLGQEMDMGLEKEEESSRAWLAEKH